MTDAKVIARIGREPSMKDLFTQDADQAATARTIREALDFHGFRHLRLVGGYWEPKLPPGRGKSAP